MASANNVVALDTNFLTAVYQLRIDVFEGIKGIYGRKVSMVVPRQVLKELERIAKRNKKLEIAATIAKELMKINKVKVKEVKAKDADDALVKLGKKGVVIATNDRELKRKVKGFCGEVLHIRQKSYIELW